jgi:hypothetical protein
MYFFGLLKAPKTHQFSKAHFGTRIKLLKKISFMNNGYKHKQIGHPRLNFLKIGYGLG